MIYRENYMKSLRLFIAVFFVFVFIIEKILFSLAAIAAFDVQGVELFRDGNLCITTAGSTTPESLNLANLQSNQESVQTKISSSGSLCVAPFFTGGALLTTSPKTIQAQPNVQSTGRGILISEAQGELNGFSSLITRLGNEIGRAHV